MAEYIRTPLGDLVPMAPQWYGSIDADTVATMRAADAAQSQAFQSQSYAAGASGGRLSSDPAFGPNMPLLPGGEGYPYAAPGDAMVPGPGGMWWPRNVQQRLFPNNGFDLALDDEKRMWEAIQEFGGLEAICPGHRYAMPPWVKQPEQGRRFSKISSIPLPAVEQRDFLVATMQVPLGYDGVIPSVVNLYTGMGFFEGSGDLVWRIQLNERYVRDYSNITTTIGSLTTPYPANTGAVRLLSGQTVNYYVRLGAGALGNLTGGRIICGLFGYFWPR